MKQQYPYLIIGIDPGTHTGFAAWHPDTKTFIEIQTYKIYEALQWIGRYSTDPKQIFVIIEDARKRGGSIAAAQGAGSVKRDCNIWQETLEYLKIPYKFMRPKNTKIDAERFKLITGHTKRTSNHARDAAMLVYGLSKSQVNVWSK